MLLKRHDKIHAKAACVELHFTFSGDVFLPGTNNHSTRKSLKDGVLQAPMGSLRGYCALWANVTP